jgi:thymidylate kinase
LRVELITFWDDVAALRFLREEIAHMVFRGDRGVGSPEAPVRRFDKNVKSPFLTLFRMAIYVLDAFSLRRVSEKLRSEGPGARADVVIFDRFIYDELANLNLERALTCFYIRTLLRLAPRLNLAFLLDADPDAAFARKPEYPPEFLRSNRAAYLGLARMVGMTVIAPSSIDEAHKEILRLVQKVKETLLPDIDAEGHVSDQGVCFERKSEIHDGKTAVFHLLS